MATLEGPSFSRIFKKKQSFMKSIQHHRRQKYFFTKRAQIKLK